MLIGWWIDWYDSVLIYTDGLLPFYGLIQGGAAELDFLVATEILAFP